MKANQIYDWRDRLGAFVRSVELEDGTIEADNVKIEIALEFCETQIRQAIHAGNIVPGSLD